MLMAWDGFVAGLKGYFQSKFGLKNCIYKTKVIQPLGTILHGLARVFLDPMKISLSLESSHMLVIGILCSHRC